MKQSLLLLLFLSTMVGMNAQKAGHSMTMMMTKMKMTMVTMAG